MKRKLFKALTSICCVALLLSVFATGALAHTLSRETLSLDGANEPIVTDCTWYYLGKVKATEQTADYFVIKMDGELYDEELYISLPAEGGFRLQSKHEYQETVEVSNVGLFEPSSIQKIDYTTDNGAVVMKGTDGTVVRYSAKGDGFALEVLNGTDRVVYITDKQISFGYNQKGDIVQTMVEMPLNPKKEAIYNGSSRYCETNVVGQHFSLTNKDCFSDPEHSYANVPLFHSNRGYSIWFNMSYPGEANFGCEDAASKEKYIVTFQGDKLDFYLWTGEPLENLKKYTELTGTSGMTEEWTFGFWGGATAAALKGENSTDYSTNPFQNMEAVLEGYKKRYNFYPEVFYGEGTADTSVAMSYARKNNIKVLTWMRPYEAIDGMRNTLNSYASETPIKEGDKYTCTGFPYVYNTLQLQLTGYYTFSASSWLDTTNPSFKDWVSVKQGQMMAWEGGGSMIDMGENLTYNGTTFSGMDAMEAHNLSSYFYGKYASEAWAEKRGNDFVLISRSGSAGSQYWTSQFQGDQRATYDGFYGAVRDLIARGAGGFNLYGSDIGGFSYMPSKDLYNRWTVLSTFSPYMRQHGYYIKTPWTMGYSSTANFGKYYYLRKNIVPSIMDAAMDASLTSDPIVKGLMVAYPYSLSLRSIDNQYLFCDDFLVCAVVSENVFSTTVTLPNGNTWYNLFTNEKVKGNQTLRVEAPIDYMPVFVKGGAVKAINLPDTMKLMTEMHDETNTPYSEHESLLITPPDEARETKIYTKVGQSEDFHDFDYTTEVYTNAPVENGVFSVTNKEGSRRQIILALGVTAADVTCDGKKLTRYDHTPDYLNEEFGYYVDLAGQTSIYVPAGWKELTIVKGDASYKQFEVANAANSIAKNMFDGEIATTYQLSMSKPVEIELDKKDSETVSRIAVKWAVGFAQSYTIEYLDAQGQWQAILPEGETKYTVSESGGGADIIEFAPVAASKFRLTANVRGDTTPLPTVYEMAFYQPDDFKNPIPPTEEDDEEYEEDEEIDWEEDEDDSDNVQGVVKDEDVDVNDDENVDDDENVGDDEDEDEGGKKVIKKRKPVKKQTVNIWLFVIIGICVVVLTAVALLLVLLGRKKKKAAAALAEAAAADAPATNEPDVQE